MCAFSYNGSSNLVFIVLIYNDLHIFNPLFSWLYVKHLRPAETTQNLKCLVTE